MLGPQGRVETVSHECERLQAAALAPPAPAPAPSPAPSPAPAVDESSRAIIAGLLQEMEDMYLTYKDDKGRLQAEVAEHMDTIQVGTCHSLPSSSHPPSPQSVCVACLACVKPCTSPTLPFLCTRFSLHAYAPPPPTATTTTTTTPYGPHNCPRAAQRMEDQLGLAHASIKSLTASHPHGGPTRPLKQAPDDACNSDSSDTSLSPFSQQMVHEVHELNRFMRSVGGVGGPGLGGAHKARARGLHSQYVSHYSSTGIFGTTAAATESYATAGERSRAQSLSGDEDGGDGDGRGGGGGADHNGSQAPSSGAPGAQARLALEASVRSVHDGSFLGRSRGGFASSRLSGDAGLQSPAVLAARRLLEETRGSQDVSGERLLASLDASRASVGYGEGDAGDRSALSFHQRSLSGDVQPLQGLRSELQRHLGALRGAASHGSHHASFVSQGSRVSQGSNTSGHSAFRADVSSAPDATDRVVQILRVGEKCERLSNPHSRAIW